MATRYWISSASGNWNDPSHWTGGLVPVPGDPAAIIQNGAFTVSVTSAISVASLDFDSPNAVLSESAAGSIATTGNFELDDGTASLAGVNSFGQLYVTGGQLQYSNSAALGGGAVVLAGGALRSTASMAVSDFLNITGDGIDTIAINAKTGTTLAIGGGGYSITGANTNLILNAPTGTTANTGTIVWRSGGNGSVNDDSIQVTIAGGILRAGDANFSTLLSSVVHVLNGGTIDLNGFSTTAGGLEIDAGGKVENTSDTAATLTFGSDIYGHDGVVGAITGNIAVEIESEAIFETSQNYTGGTTIGSNADLTIEGSGPVTIDGQIADFGSFTYESIWNGAGSYGDISGPGGVVVSSGTLLLDHASTYSGGTVILNGTLEVSKASALGTVTNTGGGGVSFDGIAGARPILIGTATETISGSLSLENKSEIAASDGKTLTLTPEFTTITSNDSTSKFSDIQIGDASHAGTVVFAAGTGLNIDSSTLVTVTVAGGMLEMGDDSLNTVFGTAFLIMDPGASFDLNGHDLTLNNTLVAENLPTFVNSSTTTATLTVGNEEVAAAPSGNLNLALSNATMALTEAAYSGTSSIDGTSVLDLAPLNANAFQAAMDAYGLSQGMSGYSLANLPVAATVGLSGAIDDAGTLTALVTKTLTLTSDISGAGAFNIFGAGTATTATLRGDNNGFTGTMLAQDVLVLVDQSTGLGSGSFAAYDAGIVFRHSVQSATKMLLNGDTSLAVADGAVATLTADLTLGTAEHSNMGANYTHMSLTLGDATHDGTIVLDMADVTENISSSQPLFVDINDGTLRAGNATALQDLASLAAAVSIAKGATVDLNGFALTLGAFTSAGTITNSAAAQPTLTISDSATVSGSISGNLGLEIAAGTTVLTGTAAPIAGTLITASGFLIVGGGGSAGTISHAIEDDGRLAFNLTTPETFGGVISGTGGVICDNREGLTLSGNNTYSGGTSINDGEVLVTNAASLGTGDVLSYGGTIIAAASTGLTAISSAANTTYFNDTVEVGAVHGAAFAFRPSQLQLDGSKLIFGDSTHNGTVNFGAGTAIVGATIAFEIAGGRVNTVGNANTFALGTMKIDAGAALNVDGLASTLVSLTGGGTLTNSAANATAVKLTGTANFSGVLAGALKLEIANTATFSGNETFTGNAVLDNHATLTISGKWSENLIFDGHDRVNLVNPNTFTGLTGGFQKGGTIDLENIAGATATHSWNAATNTLTIKGSGHTDTLKFTAGLTDANFAFGGDGSGGTTVTYQAAAHAPTPDAGVFAATSAASRSGHSDAMTGTDEHASASDAFSAALHDDWLPPLHVAVHHGDLWG